MTLVEVIVAGGVVLVGLVALIATMPFATSSIAESSLKTTATFLAQQQLERVKNAQWGWTPIPPAANPPDTLGGAGSDGTAAVSVAGFPDRWPDEAYGTIAFPGAPNCGATDRSGGCGFRRQVRITDCSFVDCSGIAKATVGVNTLRQVTVTVFFRPAGTGMAQAAEEWVRLTTLITKRP